MYAILRFHEQIGFPTSRLEMERVADIFDRNGDGYVDHKEYIDTLRPDRDVRFLCLFRYHSPYDALYLSTINDSSLIILRSSPWTILPCTIS